MPEGVLNRNEIQALLAEVAERLFEAQHTQTTLVVVGGSFMAMAGLRDTTADVDTITRLTDHMRAAIEVVATDHDLRHDWLNDRAAAFAPIGLAIVDCSVIVHHPGLMVLGPPADFVFLMKLLAARAVDYDDMLAIWPSCSFSTPQAAVAAFYAAYPHEERDPHLVDYVTQIVTAAH